MGRIERGVREGEGRGRRWARERRAREARRRLTIFSVNDVYELENLGRLREFIRAHTNDMRDPFVCTLNGDFLSPSLLSSYDLGAAAVSVMNAVPETTLTTGESRIRSLDDDSRTEIARTRRHGVELQHREHRRPSRVG